MDLNPYVSSQVCQSSDQNEVQSQRPGLVICALTTVCCCYLPFIWIFLLQRSEWLLFAITIPGCVFGVELTLGHSPAYEFWAAVFTVVLVAGGVAIGRRGWRSFVIMNSVLLAWAVFGSHGLWQILGDAIQW